MVALVATPSREFAKLRDGICASWSVAERKLRKQVALAMQHELFDSAFAEMANFCRNQKDLDTRRSADRRF
jgi:hypothetical protein